MERLPPETHLDCSKYISPCHPPMFLARCIDGFFRCMLCDKPMTDEQLEGAVKDFMLLRLRQLPPAVADRVLTFLSYEMELDF